MELYKFDETVYQIIVEAIIEGYQEYVDHRKERHNSMKISSAFAWTKGNFIESSIAEKCEKHGFKYEKSKAGLTWGYLQFRDEESKKVFLVKNAAYFNPKAFSHSITPSKSTSKRTYLQELSTINSALQFSGNEKPFSFNPIAEQLSFFENNELKVELTNLQETYNQFHIITYRIDETYQISEILHYLPNPHNNIAYELANISNFIRNAELTDDVLEILAPEKKYEVLDPYAYDIGLLDESKQI